MIEIFSTCPPSTHIARARYLECVADVAGWSERAGCAGICVDSDNTLVDPWMLSQVIVQNTKALRPLVTVHPEYTHPYWVAKQITSFAYLYGRRLLLNMVAGGLRSGLEALDDMAARDRHDARLIEYAAIVMRLLETGGPLTFDGDFYKVRNLKLTPPLSKSLLPGVFVSGSWDAGLDAAKAIGATAIKFPRTASEEERPAKGRARLGIRVGVVARDRGDRAWTMARSRFPEDRRGGPAQGAAADEESPYWLGPFKNYKTMYPYLVGSYDTVARELRRYVALGFETFIVDVPCDPDELEHINAAFARAQLAVAV